MEDIPWTIVPVKKHHSRTSNTPPLPPSTISFPAASTSLQSFARALDALDPNRHPNHGQKDVTILVNDVEPLALSTIHVTVEKDLLKNIDDVQGRFGGGFRTNGTYGLATKLKGRALPGRVSKLNGVNQSGSKADRLNAAVREALVRQALLHTGDLVQLPLPTHPITHASAPPAMIKACEPVSQGIVTENTRIVVTHGRSRQERELKRFQQSNQRLMNNVVEEEAEDTSNEQFFSAAEDRAHESSSEVEAPTDPDASDLDPSEKSGSDDSDETLEDMISLSAPGLPQQHSGVMSAVTAATPRAGGRRDGVQTPGSVFSNFTSATARARGGLGKAFKAEPLMQRLPSGALHPKPTIEDDEDAFVFVDVNSLTKIGCFSGDWVRIEATEDPRLNGFTGLDFGGLNGQAEDPADWRSVRVFGLPGLSSPKLRYHVNKPGDRRSSFSLTQSTSLTPPLFVPPVLLNNLGDPSHLRLAPLKLATAPHGLGRNPSSHDKSSGQLMPPLAKEVTLVKVSSPLSQDPALQTALFSSLKRHFEQNRRLLKNGDLVGVSIDERLSKVLYTPSKDKSKENGDDDLIARLSSVQRNTETETGVAWFRVRQLIAGRVPREDGMEEPDIWGGVAAVDSKVTTMSAGTSEVGIVPHSATNAWKYWLGMQNPPKPNGKLQLSVSLTMDVPKPYISALQRRVQELISAATSPRAIRMHMKPLLILLHSTQRSIGKATIARRACSEIGVHLFPIRGYDVLTEGNVKGGDQNTAAFLEMRAERAFSCGAKHTALLVQQVEVLTAEKIVASLTKILADSRIVIATTTDLEKVPDDIRSLVTHELEMTAPDEHERDGILKNAVLERNVRLAQDVDLAAVALKTAALVAGDLVDVVDRAVAAKAVRIVNLINSSESPLTVRDIEISGGEEVRCVTKADLNVAVDAARKNFADSIGAPKIPNVTWEDVGGLSNVKDSVMETIQLPLERPELFAKGMKKRSGILFYGPPGTGKTLLAKAIATEFSLNFFSVKGPELLNMYIGESEANVRRVFQRARDARPCVVFFDELDSVAPKRGNQGDSGGVMDRIVSQLLAELDGMSNGEEGGDGVFVIGATNRPDLLDPALLRPGRFDKMLYLGVSDTHVKQRTILEALTRKFTLAPDVSLARVADALPFTYTGADLYALCSDAMLKAITRKADAVDQKIKALSGTPVSTAYFFDHLATPDDIEVIVGEEDFLSAQKELVSSVRYVNTMRLRKSENTSDANLLCSAKELEHFERVRQTFESDDAKKKPTTTTSFNTNNSLRQATLNLNSNTKNPPALPLRPYSNNLGNQQNQSNHNASHPVRPKAKSRVNSAISSSGKGKGKFANPDSGDEGYDLDDGVMGADGGGGGGSTDDDDDYIVRTDHLGVTNGNGNGSLMAGGYASTNGNVNGKGKEKGKAPVGKAVEQRDESYFDGFSGDAGDDGELYS